MSKKLTINGIAFDVSEPYATGGQIGEAEAKVLNQVRAENVGNNLRAWIKEQSEAGAANSDMQAKVTEYDEKYNFSMGGRSAAPVDPLERECQRVAREAIKEHLAETGRKFKDVEPAELNAKIEEVSQMDEVVAEAKKRLKAKQKKLNLNLQGFGLAA